MRGRSGSLDKHPWTTVTPPSGPVEVQFIRQIVLGETIVPYRLLAASTGVIPLDGTTLLNADAATEAGFRHLAAWLRYAETNWTELSNRNADGEPRTDFLGRLDHMHLLAAQATMAPYRVFYTASGSLLSAARIGVSDAICEHGAYWTAARTTNEAAYLIAILNSASVVARVADMQVQGEAGTRRHLDKLVWTLPIPEYDEDDQVHRDLSAGAARAEDVAAGVDLSPYNHFVAKRRAIRDALVADGVARDIESLVDAILPP